MFRQIVVTLGCLGCLVGAVRADDSLAVDDGVVREAVARSLPFLEKNGVACYGVNPFARHSPAICFAIWISLGVASVTRGGFASGSYFLRG